MKVEKKMLNYKVVPNKDGKLNNHIDFYSIPKPH